MTNLIAEKNTFVKVLKAAGISEEQMVALHKEFEKQAPEAHQSFLKALGIPQEEILKIRQK